MNTITLIRPDDWHLHVRDGAEMASVIGHTARQFARAIIMPNLKPPVTTTDMALAYHERIVAAVPDGVNFEPLMTLYLTDNTPVDEIKKARDSGLIHAVKFYPAGATTHSDAGVTDLGKTFGVLAAMEALNMPLLVHGEVMHTDVDVFDRERAFIGQYLMPVVKKFPKLRIVFEHITTKDAVDFVLNSSDYVAATITVHHLLFNRNAMFKGGIRPHYYCLPILKHEPHRQALLEAATSGNPKFFLGTDSAPHAKNKKESSCGCAGIYTAHAAIELYAEVFDSVNRLDRLEAFASHYGADFYGLPRNTDTMTLKNESWTVPESYPFDNDTLIPLRAGESVQWTLDD